MDDISRLVVMAIECDLNEGVIIGSLYEICCEKHSGDCFSCPCVYINDGIVPNSEGNRYGCDLFKDGKLMMEFIKEKLDT